MLNSLFKNYFNMFRRKIKILFKRRRASKNRYSANKIFVSRAELKHTNTRLSIILYIYNKQKSLIERNIRKLIKHTIDINLVSNGDKKKPELVIISMHKNKLSNIF